ncbi:MAG: APC family permease [Fimbriimonadaceae bacterium]
MSSTGKGWSWNRLRATFFGKPIPTSRAHHERLAPILGLPVFASDALSSVAYATEAILGILVLAGIAALHLQFTITIAIALLIVIIAFSYNQTIHAYPNGGGSYIVASENLGERAGVLAGAALLIDYILTVSVSVTAGIAAIVSAFPHLHRYLVPLSLACILVIAWLNLRGVRESGRAFAIPVYAFIVGIVGMVVWGLVHRGLAPVPHQQAVTDTLGKEANISMVYLVLRAFAAGCTALTGVEAVSNGVPAFKPPESKNAATTLRWMTVLLVVMFVGIGLLARTLPSLNLYDSGNPRYRSLISQLAAATLGGDRSFGFYYVQFTTAIILVLAANTSFADFPRLSSLMARDGYLPRSLARQGDRLVFHNGIVMLACLAGALVWYFKGQLDLLLPLYAVGVFSAFTLSQAGMVVHWAKERTPRWRRSAFVNGAGAVLSGVVLLVIFLTKFMEGAWIVGVLMAIMFIVFRMIRSRYREISAQLALDGDVPVQPAHHLVLILVPRVHKGILTALEYALMIKGTCRALHVTLDDRAVVNLRRMWERYGEGVPLVILNSPYRSLIDPLLDYLDEIHAEDPDTVVTVIVPESISTRFSQKLLQENVALQLKVALSSRKNVVVTNVRYFLT